MKWLIPAKTFLLGEYAAVAEASAIVLTTTPYFELSLTSTEELEGIHPESPAGLWWQNQFILNKGLCWHDPFKGRGGLGASSAQFVGSYLASCSIQNKTPTIQSMLNAYYECSWNGKGLRPSGYDVIAQTQQGCVYINKKNQLIRSYEWPFHDLSFFLIHTGVKLATHHHLQDTALPSSIDYLSSLVDQAKQAFELTDSEQLINCINRYHEKLAELNLLAAHTAQLIGEIKHYPEVLAIKGCGALGADTILIITARNNAHLLGSRLNNQNHTLLATENSLNTTNSLLL